MWYREVTQRWSNNQPTHCYWWRFWGWESKETLSKGLNSNLLVGRLFVFLKSPCPSFFTLLCELHGSSPLAFWLPLVVTEWEARVRDRRMKEGKPGVFIPSTSSLPATLARIPFLHPRPQLLLAAFSLILGTIFSSHSFRPRPDKPSSCGRPECFIRHWWLLLTLCYTVSFSWIVNEYVMGFLSRLWPHTFETGSSDSDPVLFPLCSPVISCFGNTHDFLPAQIIRKYFQILWRSTRNRI